MRGYVEMAEAAGLDAGDIDTTEVLFPREPRVARRRVTPPIDNDKEHGD